MSGRYEFVRLSHAFNSKAFYSNYRKTFSIIKADTPELLAACFKLRYLVYCAENGFQKYRHTERLEYDAHDKCATHFLLRHIETGKNAGTVRVILPDAQNPANSFPLQKICDHPFLHAEKKLKNICQISRLCMHPDFRRRDTDGKILPAYDEQEDVTGTKNGNLVFIRRRTPYAPLGLLQAAFEIALQNNIMNCVILIESEQLPHFVRLGIPYTTLGAEIRNNGIQQPILFNIKNVFDTMVLENPQSWDIISDMGRIHKMANDLYQNDWRDHIMDDLSWEKIWEKLP